MTEITLVGIPDADGPLHLQLRLVARPTRRRGGTDPLSLPALAASTTTSREGSARVRLDLDEVSAPGPVALLVVAREEGREQLLARQTFPDLGAVPTSLTLDLEGSAPRDAEPGAGGPPRDGPGVARPTPGGPAADRPPRRPLSDLEPEVRPVTPGPAGRPPVGDRPAGTDRPGLGDRPGGAGVPDAGGSRPQATPLRRPPSFFERYTERGAMSGALESERSRAIAQRAAERRDRRARGAAYADERLGRRPLLDGASGPFAARRDELPEIAERARDDGLKSLESRHGLRRGITLREGSSPDLDDGRVEVDRLARSLGVSGGVARRAASEPCRAQKEAEAALAAPGSGADTEDDAAPAPNAAPPSQQDAAARIGAALAEILGSDSFSKALASRPDREAIRQSLQAELALGPADVPAHFDHEVLHVAWKDTWMAALDHAVKGDVAELYAAVVELADYDPPPPGPNAEVNELKELLNELSGVVDSVAAEVGNASEIQAWLGGAVPVSATWAAIPVYDQQLLFLLYEISTVCTANRKVLDPAVKSKPGEIKMDKPENYFDSADDAEAWVEDNGHVLHHVVHIPNFGWRAFYQKYVTNTNPVSDYLDAEAFPPSELLAMSVADVLAQGAAEDGYNLARTRARELVEAYAAAADKGHHVSPLGRAEQLIERLQAASDRPYQFDVFAPGTNNFGLLARYRQTWRPLAYQAGDLAGTIPLAPNEERSFTVRRKETRTSRRADTLTGLLSRQEEMGSTARAESEINRKTTSSLKTGATFDSTVGADALVAGTELRFGGNIGSDSGSDSGRIKRDLNETTRRMAQEYRDERKVEVSTETVAEAERTETRKISNPNNEITVTYLFYELQRRFEVSTRLHEIEPVILVAQQVPTPDAINEAWVLKHEWILRGALIDRKFLPVLRVLSESFVGDEVAVEILETQWKTQLQVVGELRRQLAAFTDLRDSAREAVQEAARKVRSPQTGGGGSGPSVGDVATDAMQYGALAVTTGVGGILAKALFDLSKNAPDDDDAMTDAEAQMLAGEALAAERESARQALDWSDVDHAKAELALREAIGALERATERYLEAVTKRLNRRTRVDQLLVHIRSNILHYMQAIWRAENSDQRYLRLYDQMIDWPGDEVRVRRGPAPTLSSTLPAPPPGLGVAPAVESTLTIEPVTTLSRKRPLHEVADLDTVLGFRGNYMVFRLREQNALSLYMMQDFLDSHLGVSDPDGPGNGPTVEEAIERARCAWNRPGVTDREREQISVWLVEAVEEARARSELVTVPTGELFIEALPGSHPVLEDFKLRHRAADAARAESEARMGEVEVLRRAQKLLDRDTSDPDVDKVIRIEGGTTQVTVDPEA